MYSIPFADAIIKDQVHNLGDQRLYNNVRIWKKGSFDILRGISENVTLVQLMDSVVNFNYAVIIFGYWILDSNKKGASVDTGSIESHTLSFGKRSNACHVRNSLSHSQIHQQHRETKYF